MKLHDINKPWHVRPTKTEIILRIRIDRIKSSLSAWRNFASLAIQTAQKHRFWVLVRTASPRRSKEYQQSIFWAEIWKISECLSENFQFLEVKFSIYLNRRVFVMSWTSFILFLVLESSEDSDYNAQAELKFGWCTCPQVRFLTLRLQWIFFRKVDNNGNCLRTLPVNSLALIMT